MAVVFWATGLWLQVAISKHGGALAPALMIGSFILRLGALAAIVIPLAAYTDLNLVALLVTLIGVFTVLLVWGLYLQVKRAGKEGSKGA